MKKLYLEAVKKQNLSRPPVWFMRQAGRYHSHYQELKKRHSFLELCKIPEVACEATMGPIRDFGFDAAILFSDLLFPLEAMGMGLDYVPGPKLGWHLKSKADLAKLKGGVELVKHVAFQGEALKKIRTQLDQEGYSDRALLGFVGGPLTLFFYAVDGSHQGDLSGARKGLKDGCFDGFCEKLEPMLVENMVLQADSGADAVAVLDTCAGEIDAELFRAKALPALKRVLEKFRAKRPEVPVVYYSKGTGPEHWRSLADLPFECLGIDWHHDIAKVLKKWGSRWSIQGNFDPELMLLPSRELEPKIRDFLIRTHQLPPEQRKSWVCGLGHGVLQMTPEENVKLFLKLQKEIFAERS